MKDNFQTRPVVMGTKGVVVSGHYLATTAGLRILHEGGNAIDAGAAVCFCLNVLEPQANGTGGECPTLIYSSKEKNVYALSGMGYSPEKLTLKWCKENNIDMIPGDGYIPACVPSVVGTWLIALIRFGKLSLSEILQPAIELARDGFPVYDDLNKSIKENYKKFIQNYPSTAKIYCPKGKIPETGEILKNPDLAEVYELLVKTEKKHLKKGRTRALISAMDEFYKGSIAKKIANFIKENPVIDSTGKKHTGLLSYNDFKNWHATIEKPVKYNFHGFDVYKCPPWTQGPVFLQQLALLKNFNLRALKHNSAEYLHILIECAKLAFADREAYYGDPDFDDVPLETLLSEKYNRNRAKLVTDKCSFEMRPGMIEKRTLNFELFDILKDNRNALKTFEEKNNSGNSTHNYDTTQLDVIDSEGNMVSCTPSGGWFFSSPVIDGLGFPLGTRAQMFYLNPLRANSLEPFKRPRTTLTPSLILKDGKPKMVFGTPGGDSQDQWALQFFLNRVVFKMNLQQALDEPTMHILHFPSSFYPRKAYPGTVAVENRIPEKVIRELKFRGHKIIIENGWCHGKVMAIEYDEEKKVIKGAVSAKGIIGYAGGF